MNAALGILAFGFLLFFKLGFENMTRFCVLTPPAPRDNNATMMADLFKID